MQTPLFMATRLGMMEIMLELIENGANVNHSLLNTCYDYFGNVENGYEGYSRIIKMV